MAETNSPNPPEDSKPPNGKDGGDLTTVDPSAARPEDLTDEGWALIERRRGNKQHDAIGLGSERPADATEITRSATNNDARSKKRRRNMFITLGATAATLAITAGTWVGLSGGEGTSTEPKAQNPAVAPVTPGETQVAPIVDTGDAGYWYEKFSKEGLSNVYLSAEQKAVLENGSQDAKNEVLDNTLIPLLDSASMLLSEKNIEGDTKSVDLSSISDDPTVQRFVRQITERLNPQDPQWEQVRICTTTNNADGSGQCLPGLQSFISDGSDGQKTLLFGIMDAEISKGGQLIDGQPAYTNQYPYRDSVHYVIGEDDRIQLER